MGVTRFLLKPSNMEEPEEAIGIMCENLKRKGIVPEAEPEMEEKGERASSSFIEKMHWPT